MGYCNKLLVIDIEHLCCSELTCFRYFAKKVSRTTIFYIWYVLIELWTYLPAIDTQKVAMVGGNVWISLFYYYY